MYKIYIAIIIASSNLPTPVFINGAKYVGFNIEL